ncbi:MAG: DUF3305 domain-containing protein [Cocleimonas sp.]|nr:DUF3305 domain-containing protein [Cocleimonas sp.]
MNQTATPQEPQNPSENSPNSFPVSVIMESRPSQSKWVDEVWDGVGVVAQSGTNRDDIKVSAQDEVKQVIYGGHKVNLYIDECESYYHNLMSPEPGCFIVAREEDEDGEETDIPIPFLVTMSFDEAHAYLEGDDIVYAVPIQPELYLWVEAYILENYSAEKRKKRKRKDWKKGE